MSPLAKYNLVNIFNTKKLYNNLALLLRILHELLLIKFYISTSWEKG